MKSQTITKTLDARPNAVRDFTSLKAKTQNFNYLLGIQALIIGRQFSSKLVYCTKLTTLRHDNLQRFTLAIGFFLSPADEAAGLAAALSPEAG